LLQVRIYLQF